MSGFVGVEDLLKHLERAFEIDTLVIHQQKNVLTKALMPLSEFNKNTTLITPQNIKEYIDKIPHSFYKQCKIENKKQEFDKYLLKYLTENIKYMIN